MTAATGKPFGGLGAKGEGIKQKRKNTVTDTVDNVVISRGKRGLGEVEGSKGG